MRQLIRLANRSGFAIEKEWLLVYSRSGTTPDMGCSKRGEARYHATIGIRIGGYNVNETNQKV